MTALIHLEYMKGFHTSSILCPYWVLYGLLQVLPFRSAFVRRHGQVGALPILVAAPSCTAQPCCCPLLHCPSLLLPNHALNTHPCCCPIMHCPSLLLPNHALPIFVAAQSCTAHPCCCPIMHCPSLLLPNHALPIFVAAQSCTAHPCCCPIMHCPSLLLPNHALPIFVAADGVCQLWRLIA